MIRMRIIWSTIIVLLNCITSDALNKTGLLINCGLPNSTQTQSSLDGREWQSDNNPAFAPSYLNTVSTNVSEDAEDLPYKTGRVFWSNITYTFSISTPGPIFLRLYFFPNVSYNSTPPHLFSTSLFANNYTLLHNFNPFLNSPGTPLIYEFQIIIQNGENNLNLTFSPGAANSNDTKLSYGYVNGIEIRSIPEGLYINQSNLNYFYVTDPNTSYSLQNESTAFQTAYRLNVGGEIVDGSEDNPGGMKRKWEADDAYMVGDFFGVKMEPSAGDNITTVFYTQKTPSYVAPKTVYGSTRDMGDYPPNYVLARNLTWMFNVDPGFDYVVRLHFCQLDSSVTEAQLNLMSVYIGGLLASDLDIWAEAGGLGIPVYKDYVISLPGTSNGSKFALSLTLLPRPT